MIQQVTKVRKGAITKEPVFLITRSAEFSPTSLNLETRSVEAVVSSENPVPDYDRARREIVQRVLLADGSRLRGRTKKMSLLDSHNRDTVRNVIGSAIARSDGDKVVATLSFSSTAEDEFTKVREGHLDSVSVGFVVNREEYVPRGQVRTIQGRSFQGPVNVATDWELREVSLVAVGADEEAKMRAEVPAYPDPGGPSTMAATIAEYIEKYRAEKGSLPTDEEMAEYISADKERLAHFHERIGGGLDVRPEQDDDSTEKIVSRLDKLLEERLKKEDQIRREREAEHLRETAELCKLAGLHEGEATAIARDNPTIQQVRAAIISRRDSLKDEYPTRLGIHLPDEQPVDRHRQVLADALLERSFQSAGHDDRQVMARYADPAKLSADRERYRHASLLDIARTCIVMDGLDARLVQSLSAMQIACAALGVGDVRTRPIQVRADGGGWHTTGSFSYITANALNKNLLAGYGEFPATWRGPMRQGASVPDFKTVRKIRIGEIENLPTWPDNTIPNSASISDSQETYAVEAHALMTSFSWQLIVNDDLDAISRAPAMMGQSAARTVNAVAWAQVTSNPTMADGQTLFLETPSGNRKRSNLTTGAAVPSVDTIGAMRTKMRLMRGENTREGSESPAVLNLTPRFIVGPAALENRIKQEVLSPSDIAKNNSLAINPVNGLEVVIEPLLDANSSTAWYLFASPSQIDTVEVAFLRGQETPFTQSWTEEQTLSRNYMIVQTFTAKALNHRGIIKHAGA